MLQLDFLQFIQGLSCLLMAHTAWAQHLRPGPARGFCWRCLAVAATLQAMAQWLEVVGLTLSHPAAVKSIVFVLEFLSYVFLFEFSRRRLPPLTSVFSPLWLPPLLLACLVTGLWGGWFAFASMATYLLAVPALLGLAWNLFAQSRLVEAPRGLPLRLSAGIFLLMGLVAVAATYEVKFFPASVLNMHTFQGTTGLPVQLVLTVLATAGALTFWWGWRRRQEDYVLALPVLLVLLALLAGYGWMLTERRGRGLEAEIKKKLQFEATAIARAIDPHQVEHLTFTEQDLKNPAFRAIEEQMRRYAAAVGYRSIYSMVLRDGAILFGPESLTPGDPFDCVPGTSYQSPPAIVRQLLAEGGAAAEGPYTDEYGTFVSGFATVQHPRKGTPVLLVGLDIEASTMQVLIARERFAVIAFFALLALVLVGGNTFLAGRFRSERSPGFLCQGETLIVLLVGGIIAAGMAIAEYQHSRRSGRLALVQYANSRASALLHLVSRLQSQQLAGLEAVMRQPVESQAQFEALTRPFTEDYFVAGVGWAAPMAAGERRTFDGRMRLEKKDFALFHRADNGMRQLLPEGRSACPVTYVAPRAELQAAIGYDLQSDAQCWPVVQEALAAGMPMATGLVPGIVDRKPVIVLYRPVTTAPEGGGDGFRLLGIAFVAVRLDALVTAVFQDQPAESAAVAITLHQLDPQGRGTLLVATDRQMKEMGAPESSSLLWSSEELIVPLFAFGRTYALSVHARDGFFPDNALLQAALSAAAGLVVTFLIARILHLMRLRRENLEQEVQLRTEELERSNRLLQENAAELSKLSQVVEQTTAAVLITDRSGAITYVNDAFCRVSGYSRPEALGKNPHILKSGYMASELYGRLWRTITAGQQWTGELENRRKDGKLYWELATISPLFNAAGEITHFVGIKNDITPQKRADAALRATVDELAEMTARAQSLAREAESASRAKSEFLANMSHEIRTPMNAILGMTHLAMNTPLTPQQEDYLGKIDRAAKSLLRIIDDILDFSRIEAGAMTVEAVPFALGETLRDVASIVSVKAAEKDLPFLIHLAGDVPPHLTGDPLRLGQVLINLAGNAVKFTSQGKVELKVELHKLVAGEARVRFTVSDTGIGMTAEQAARLFVPFGQADTSTTRRFGGTGLGLTISQRLVRLMGGEIEIASTPGAGSVFSFILPLPVAAAPQRRERADRTEETTGSDALHGYHLLLVEDNTINQEIARTLLERAGARVTIAANGAEAVARVASDTFDLVLMDIQMPEMDGLEATARIRQKGFVALPIIAMTANVLPEEVERARAAGMNDHLAKPIVPAIFFRTLRQWLPLPAEPPEPLPLPVAGNRPMPIRGIDLDEAISRLGDGDLLLEILGDVRRHHRGDAALLLQALAAGDLPRARFVAHTLRGMAANIGARSLSSAAARLEAALVTDPPADLDTLAATVCTGLEELLTELDTLGSLAGEEAEQNVG